MSLSRFSARSVLTLVWMILVAATLGVAVPHVAHVDHALAFDAPPKDQGHSGPNGDGPDDENPDDPDQDEDGDPVQLKTGNFKMSVEDAALDSFALPISMQRIYNTLDTVNDGPFGRGWSTSYVMSIREVTYFSGFDATAGVVGTSGGGGAGAAIAIFPNPRVVLRDDTGARHVFNQGPGNTWVASRARFGTLVKTGAGRFTWTRKDGVQFRFTSSRLDSIIDTNGNTLSMEYDSAGRLSRVTNPAGRTLTYAYNSNSKVASITDNIGRTVTYTYTPPPTDIFDLGGNLLRTVTNQRGETTTYGYDSRGRLNAITSPDGTVVMTNTYDTKGRVTSQTAYGASFTYTYNAAYTRVRNSRNFYTDNYFNEFGNPIQTRDLRGNTKYFTWDDDGNMLTKRDQLNRTTTFTYTNQGEIATRTTPDGGVTAYVYDNRSRMISMTDPLGRVTTMGYDVNGNLTSVTDPLGQVETFTRDAAGRLLTATDEAGNVATYSYNAAGDLATHTDENGLVTTYTYDAVGRVTSVSNGAGETTSFTYTPRNRLLTSTDPLGKVTTYGYNANDEQISMTDPLGKVWTKGFDGVGRLVSDTDPLGNVTALTYDSLANLSRITDPEGRQTNHVYDAGNLRTGTTRPDGSTVAYVYDAVANLTRVTNPRGVAVNYTYDVMDRPVTVTYADGTTTTRTYDLAGRMTQSTDRKGQVFTYAYDDLDRMTQITLPNDGTITYAYDARDNLVSSTGYSGTLGLAYDAGNRVSAETGVWGDVLNYGYDAADRLTTLTRPNRYTVSYGYDSNGRMTSATAPSGTVSYGYDASDRLVSEALPNGVTVAYGYDDADRMTSVTYIAADGTTVLMSNTYTYDDSGLITGMTEADGTTHAYTYDAVLRLVSEVITPPGGPASTTTWTYDTNGNRLTQTRDGVITNYTYNTVDELETETGITYSYDDNGNLLTAVTATETETYAYDDLNRLNSVGDGSFALSFGYDAGGIRVSRTENGTTSQQVRWGSVLLEEKDPVTGAPLKRFDYGLNLTATAGAFGTRHYMIDGIGGVRALSDPAGVVTDTYAFGAHGDTMVQNGTTPNPYVFNGAAGYYAEGQGDLLHVGARYYDAGVGRFAQTDPVRQGFNAYSHAMNNPVNYNDPSGEIIPLIAWCARGAASGLIEDEIMHHAFDGKEERTWTDRAVSAGLGCLTGGFGGKARRAANAADAASDAARRCRGGRCTVCSFEGDTQVVTDSGLVAIRDIDPLTMRVLSRDEVTGEVAFRKILDHYSNEYDTTVRLSIRAGNTGAVQTIVSNTIHPYFAVPKDARVIQASSEGVVYRGDIAGGAWVNAGDLRPGDVLLTAAGSWSEVVEVQIVDKGLTAYNMSVDVSDSYFVTNGSSDEAVWVHNCPPMWSPGKQGDNVQNAFDHWKKHGNEFPEFGNSKQYVEGAQDFLRNPPPGTLTKTRPNGDVLRYNPSTNTVGVMDSSGAPRTMFRPSNGAGYWANQ